MPNRKPDEITVLVRAAPSYMRSAWRHILWRLDIIRRSTDQERHRYARFRQTTDSCPVEHALPLASVTGAA
nr:hypothetical protein CFP56_32308 [Quercus suber]